MLLCMHSRLDMHHDVHYVVFIIMMLLVRYGTDMLVEMELEMQIIRARF